MQVKHVSGGHPDLVSDRVLNTSNVRCCQRCGFFTADAAEFKQHMLEHRGTTKFYCFYCNKVSFSEAELNTHLKEHNSKYPFKCPHCGQGYMRRLCLVKHIERLHSDSVSQVPANSGTTKNPHVPVSGALFSVPITDAASLRPAVRVKVPALSTPAVRLGKDEQRGKTLDTKVSNATTGNGLTQQSRALTVSLPEEVTIPAGCLVELVEVKTVNGTKELKLRLVSQQENESVIKDTRTTVSQNAALGKPFLSTLNHANAVKSMSMGMCTVNRKQCETKTVNVDVERPAVVPVNISKNLPNQVSKERCGLKRKSQEIINLECHTAVPNKVPKSIFNPVRDGDSGIKVAQREPVNHNGALPSVTSNRLINRLMTSTLLPDNMGASVSQRVMDERNNLIPEHSKSIPPRRASDIKIKPRDVAIKLEPEVMRNDTPSTIKKEAVGLDLQKSAPSLSVLLNSTAKVGPPASLVHKDNAGNSSFLLPRFLNLPSAAKTPGLSNRTNSKISAWTQEVRSNERAGEGDMPEPESFPIISSVFSLSQQPEDVQGSMQPLVMALRGIVMDKSNSSSSTQDPIKIINSTEQVKEAPRSGFCAQMATSDGSVIRKLLLTGQTSDSVKVESLDKSIQHPPARTHIPVKEERYNTMPDNKKCSPTLASKSTDEESVSKIATHVNAPEPLQQMEKMEHDISKFLTVSLKRVQVGVWKKSKKGLKLRISKYKTQVPMGCAVIYPMPLKEDQLVKRPGPYQPVVVLNHPNPRASVQAARADTLSDTGASEVAPKCQILKMRLSKVMGQKYEVMGCTVGVFP